MTIWEELENDDEVATGEMLDWLLELLDSELLTELDDCIDDSTFLLLETVEMEPGKLVDKDELDEPSSVVSAPQALRNKNAEAHNQSFTGAIADIIF